MTPSASNVTGSSDAGPPKRVKRSRASLIGGVAVGIGVAILTVLAVGGPTPGHIVLGVAVGTLIATWVRLADL